TSASTRSGTTRSAAVCRCSAMWDRASTRRSCGCSTLPAGTDASVWTSACRWRRETAWCCAIRANETQSAAPRCWTPPRAGAPAASELRADADRLRAALADDGELVVERGYVRDATRRPGVGESAEARALLDALETAPFSPPEPASAGADPALVRSLVREGALV